jgi:hypothetical protein
VSGPQLHMTIEDRREQLSRVRMACRYISDDSTVASVLGVPIALVASERSKIKPARASTFAAAGVHDTTYHINDGARREAATKSCSAHLDALIRYGWRHDGLPGLSAGQFRALAEDRGVGRG